MSEQPGTQHNSHWEPVRNPDGVITVDNEKNVNVVGYDPLVTHLQKREITEANANNPEYSPQDRMAYRTAGVIEQRNNLLHFSQNPHLLNRPPYLNEESNAA